MEEYERTGQTKVTNLPDSNIAKNTNQNNNTNLLMNNLSQQQHHLQHQDQQQHQFFQQQQQQQLQAAFNLNQQQSQQQTQQQLQQQQQQLQQQQQSLTIPPPIQAVLNSSSQFSDARPVSQPSSIASNDRDDSVFVKSEPMDELDGKNDNDDYQMAAYRQQQVQQQANMFYNNYETKSESGSSDILSRPQTPNSLYSNINEMINQQIESIPINNINAGGVPGNMSQMGPPKKFQLNKIFDKSYESNSSSSNSSTSSGKRANRTRFTDYQIKVLQEFFENNSYPKDSDLEYLSKLLLLSPRVIVVWFQVSLNQLIFYINKNT